MAATETEKLREEAFRAGYLSGFNDGCTPYQAYQGEKCIVWRQGPRWVQYRDKLCRRCNQPVADPLVDHLPGEGCRADGPHAELCGFCGLPVSDHGPHDVCATAQAAKEDRSCTRIR